MKNVKKWAALFLTAAMLTGCGSAASETVPPNETPVETIAEADSGTDTGNDAAADATADTGSDASADQAADASADAGSDTTEDPAADASADAPANPNQVDGCDIPNVLIGGYNGVPDTEPFAFVREMKIIWNLGNTFDAYSDQPLANELDTETYWHGVRTTEQTIKNIHAEGFETVRIPVSWHNHFTDDDYTISEEWLARVQEVVDYAINDGMHVILNIHHDNHEEFGCFYPDSEHLDQSVHYIERIWSQLSERFADYDEKLIFEGMNEPRLVGHTNEWWIDEASEDCKDAIECINVLNQTFVDTVRAGGGQNETRYLMCPGYCASLDGVTNEGFRIPEDPKGPEGHIMLEVHAYTPYAFALEDNNKGSFDSANSEDVKDIDATMNKLYMSFVSKGVPVVVDEFGARDKKGNYQDRVDYATYLVASARARGITCGWWDNGALAGSGEIFAIYDRRQEKVAYPAIIAGLMKYAE